MRILLTAVGLAGLLFVLKAPGFPEVVDFDEQQYFLQGRQLVDGRGFYTLSIEARPPLLTIIFGAIYRFWGFSPLALRLVAAAAGIVTLLIFYLLALALFERRTALLAAILFALLSGSRVLQAHTANTENFVLPFSLLGILLYLVGEQRGKNLVFLSGLCLGVGFMVKQVSTFDWAAIYVIGGCKAFREERGSWPKLLRFTVTFAGAFILPWLLFCFYFYWNGALGLFLKRVYWNNVSYGLNARLYGSSLTRALVFFKSTAGQLWPFLIVALAGLVHVLRRRCWEELLVATWLAFALVGASLPGFFFPHYFIAAIPPLALLGSIGTSAVASTMRNFLAGGLRMPRFRVGGIVAGIVVAVAFWLNYPHAYGYARYMAGGLSRSDYLTRYRFPDWEERYRAGQFLNEVMHRSDQLYIWDSTVLIHLITGCRDSGGYYKQAYLDHSFLLPTEHSMVDFKDRSDLYSRLAQRPPDFIVLAFEPEKIFHEMKLFSEFSGFVQLNYQFIRSFGNVQIYRRRNSPLLRSPVATAPIDLVKRYAAITEMETASGGINLTFEPFVNPEGILQKFSAYYGDAGSGSAYPTGSGLAGNERPARKLQLFSSEGGISLADEIAAQLHRLEIDVRPISGADLRQEPSTYNHLRITRLAGEIEWVRVRQGSAHWCNQSYGVNRVIRVDQRGSEADLYFEGHGRDPVYQVYVVYRDAGIGYTSVPAAPRATGDEIARDPSPDDRFEYEDEFENPRGKFRADARSQGCTWVPGAGGSLACENSIVSYRFQFPRPVSAARLESASPHPWVHLFWADGNSQLVYVDFSRDGSHWQNAYSYRWTGERGIRASAHAPDTLSGSREVHVRVRTTTPAVGHGVQWYSVKLTVNFLKSPGSR